MFLDCYCRHHRYKTVTLHLIVTIPGKILRFLLMLPMAGSICNIGNICHDINRNKHSIHDIIHFPSASRYTFCICPPAGCPYTFSICQSTGCMPCSSRKAFAWLKCLHPKNPRYADSGLGCGAFKIRCFGLFSIGILLCAGLPHSI